MVNRQNVNKYHYKNKEKTTADVELVLPREGAPKRSEALLLAPCFSRALYLGSSLSDRTLFLARTCGTLLQNMLKNRCANLQKPRSAAWNRPTPPP